MKTQQQLNQSEPDSLQEFDYDQEEETALTSSPRAEGKFMALLIFLIFLLLAAVVLLTLFIASSLEETPKIHIEYLEDSYLPSARSQQKPKFVKEAISGPLMNIMAKEIKRITSTPQILVDIELTNGAHRNYQNIMRQLESDTCHLALDKFSSRKISKDSGLTYKQYLNAVDYLQLTTFPINDVYNDFIKMSIKEKDYFEEKYSLSTFLRESSICAVMVLTREGLQNGNYYYALKSLLHQQYWNLKVVVINSPEMGMLEDVNKLLSQFPFVDVTLIDKIGAKQTIGSSFFIRGAIHKYCKQSELTLLLRDTGQLIGRQALKVMNKAYNENQPVVLFTNYLLQSSNPIKQSSDPFKYQVQLYPSSLANPRSQAYKTKYLKMYKTEHLLQLEERYFHLAQGWTNGLFEASLEFAMLQLGCGRYYLLEEIFYKATKNDIENALQVLDARAKQRLQCFQEVPLINSKKNQQDLKTPPQADKEFHFLDINQIRNLTNDEIIMLKSAFRQAHASRTSLYSKIYLKDAKMVNQSAIDHASITQASGITLKHVTDIAEKLHIGIRPALYLDQLRKQQDTQTPLPPQDGKKVTNSNAPRLSDAQPSPFAADETQFCVFLFTRNNYNKLSFLYTIESIITQMYSKFRLIILDNKSNDLTAEVIKHHLSIISPNQQSLVTFKQASRSLRRSELLHHAISKYSLPNEVVIVIDSGEEFLQNNIFKQLNSHYKKTQALAVYSNAIYLQNDVIHVGSAKPPPSQVIQEKSYRKHPIYFQKLRSFKSLLFSKIQQRDFRDESGEWVKEREDQILALAIQQQVCGNMAYLNRILVRLAQKPASNAAPSNIGFKYACVEPSKLQTAP